MVKDFDAHLHKYLRPSSKIPDFKTFPEHRPWPVLYWEMIQYDKKYLSYMLHNLKIAAEETINTKTNLSLLDIWEKFHSNMDWHAGESYIWFRVIKHREAMTDEERKQEAEELMAFMKDAIEYNPGSPE